MLSLIIIVYSPKMMIGRWYTDELGLTLYRLTESESCQDQTTAVKKMATTTVGMHPRQRTVRTVCTLLYMYRAVCVCMYMYMYMYMYSTCTCGSNCPFSKVQIRGNFVLCNRVRMNWLRNYAWIYRSQKHRSHIKQNSLKIR